MDYETMWAKLQGHILETMKQIDTYDITGLFVVAGLANTLTQMIVLEDENKEG